MEHELQYLVLEIAPLPEFALEALVTSMQHLELPGGYTLLQRHKISNHLWFLTSGAARGYYTDEHGRERNIWLSFDKDVLADAASFTQQQPSEISIQVIENSTLYSIDYEKLTALTQQHHALALWYIKLIEKYYIAWIENRVAELQFLSAPERYQKLLEQVPSVTNRVSLGHIASYLNITPETLSRIRARK